MILRTGKIRASHFAHRGDSKDCRFLNEGCRHLAAKHAILLAVKEWKRGRRPSPEIRRRCAVCAEERNQKIPKQVAAAELERRIPLDSTGTCIVADVALVNGRGEPLALVEVRDTHSVDEMKKERIKHLPWMEVEAREILENPFLWNPVESGNLKKTACRCDRAVRMPVIYRGYALHADGCPVPARVWRGKPYANVNDDCSNCEYCVGIEYPKGREAERGPPILYCSGFKKKEGKYST